MQSFVYSIAIIPWSWILGMLINRFLQKKDFYAIISNLVFIRSETLNNILGVNVFKWIVKHTFFKYLNQKIKITSRPDCSGLKELRKEMTFSEMSHWFGFLGIMILVLVLILFNGNYDFGLTLFIMNVIFNLYPSLLQQKNKQRIDKICN